MERTHSFCCRFRSVALAVVLAASFTACQAPPPEVAAERSIEAALDLPEPIEFRTEGAPIDESFDRPGTLTLAEAVRRAATTDPSIQAALARVRIMLAEADQARLWPNPVLNMALRWPESGGGAIVEASLAQDLIAILRVPRLSSAADNRLRRAAADAITIALDLAAQVQERYAAAQALDALLPVLEARRELLERLIELADARLKAGEGARQDLTVLEAQRVELEVEIASVEQERRDERLQLARLLGEPSGPADWPLDRWSAPVHSRAPESAWIETALQHRPEIQAIAWELAALGDDFALTQLLPWEGASAGAQVEYDEGWSMGPEASSPLPLFDTGEAREAKVIALQIEARHELTRIKRAVVEDVRRAHASLSRIAANLQRVRDELIPLQEQRRSVAEALFRAGEADALALFLAEQDVRAAQAKAVDLERQMTIAHLRLHRAVGGAGIASQVAARDLNEHGEGATND